MHSRHAATTLTGIVALGATTTLGCKILGILPEGTVEISARVESPPDFTAGQVLFVERHEGDMRELDRGIARKLGRWGFDASSGHFQAEARR